MDINFLGDSHWKNRIVIGGLVEEWGGEYKTLVDLYKEMCRI